MRLLTFAALWFVWLPSFAVQAKTKADDLDKQARKACLAGDFRKGVDLLTDLYVRTEDPTYIYNQGRCYEQNHQWVSAIDRFREYLRKTKDHTPAATEEVESHIAECKRLLDEDTAKPSLPPQPATPPVASAPTVPPPPPPPIVPVDEHPGAALRVTGIVAVSAGIATLATALILNLKANSLADEANQHYNPGAESSQKSYKTGALVCYGAGGAAVVAGATLYLIGRSKGANAAGLALIPTWKPGEAGLALHGEF